MKRLGAWRRWVGIGGSVLGLLLGSADGYSQTAAQPVSGVAQQQAAKALYDEGKKLKGGERWEEAILKFEASTNANPADPATQLSNLFQIAECHEKLKQLTSAWSNFKSAEVIARTQVWPEDEKEARDRAEALMPRLSRLKVVVPREQMNAGMKVWVNGKEWGLGKWNQGEAIDAGEYRVEAQVSGSEKWLARVRVEEEGITKEVLVPRLVVKAVEEGGADVVGKPLDYRFWLGLSGVALGTAGLIAGGFFGSQYSDSKSNEERDWNRVDDPANDRDDACVQPMLTEQMKADCDKLRAQVDESKALSQKTAGFLVAGGIVTAAGLGTLIWYYLDKPEAKKDDRSLRILPGAPGTWAGMGVGGTF